MEKLRALIRKCRKSDSSVVIAIVRYAYYKLMGKNILTNHRVIVKGANNITTHGLLQIGIDYVGFMHKYDRTYLNIGGQLIFEGDYNIGKGCRFDIGSNAIAKFGSGYVNCNSKFIIMHKLTVGEGCYISWGCEFLDEDFHQLSYQGKKNKGQAIEIGNHVWLGSNVTVLKGSVIPDGCVIASGSVICAQFDKPNCLIGGNPAKVIKENVAWE